MKNIKSIEELKKICIENEGDWVGCFIHLNGNCRSSKAISWQEDCFVVVNEIDDTVQELTEKEIMDESLTNIGKAIKLNSFYLDGE